MGERERDLEQGKKGCYNKNEVATKEKHGVAKGKGLAVRQVKERQGDATDRRGLPVEA